METFSIAFKVGNLELDAIVTAFDHHRRFKVEMVTNEHDPIVLQRITAGEWKVEQAGQRSISEQGFAEIQEAIDRYLEKIYAVHNILVLTDFSAAATNAAKYAAAMARNFNSINIILYHSMSVPLATEIPLQTPPAAVDFQQETLSKLEELKNELLPLTGEGTAITVRTDERPLLAAVNMLAEQQQLGLVVMGITGKGNLERVFIGSNTITIAKECKVPLLIVPAGAVFEKINRVVFACDLKKVSETTPTQSIKTLVHKLDAKLYILNVARDGARFNPATINELAALHRLWDEEQPEYHYTDNDDLVKGIMDFTKEHQIQLLVTVPREYGFFEGIFHRSMTEKLAYHTHLPLLLFREDK